MSPICMTKHNPSMIALTPLHAQPTTTHLHDTCQQLTTTATCCCCCLAAEAEPSNIQPNSDLAVATDRYTSSPKRQYLIAPRIGRSPLPKGPSSIWSALEEASFIRNGQVQPQRAYPGPLRSSLLFLVGNQRLGRSTGLLPQARIGRRAPMGLMPQPRIGRRSYPGFNTGADSDGEADPGCNQQEAPSSLASSDTISLANAIGSLMED